MRKPCGEAPPPTAPVRSDMAETITIDFSKPVPLFPLPGVVLMPHAAAPLHIFEERYRAMTNRALDSNGLIAMATPDEDGVMTDHGPALDEVVCVGYIGRHKSAGDGRYHILLQGLTRAKVVEEVDPAEGGFRRALLQPIQTEEVSDFELDHMKGRLIELISDEKLSQLAVIKMAQEWVEHDLPPVPLFDLLTHALCTDADTRYEILCDENPIERATRLELYLQNTRHLIDAAGDPEEGTDDSGFPLN